MSNPVGRPLKWGSVQELQEKIDVYFDAISAPRVSSEGVVYYEPITITGLALALDTTRETLCDYEEKDEFSDTIKRAKLRCENFAERMLYNGKSPTGAIFSLKNFGWKDNNQIDIGNKDNKPFATTQKISERDREIVNEFLKRKGVKND
jgi:hypothetical protein